MGDKESATVEAYQAVVIGFTAIALLVHSVKRLVAVWPRFLARIETDTTAGLDDALSGMFKGERGH